MLQGVSNQDGNIKIMSHAVCTRPSCWCILFYLRVFIIYIYKHINQYINALGFFVQRLGGDYWYYSNLNDHNFNNYFFKCILLLGKH